MSKGMLYEHYCIKSLNVGDVLIIDNNILLLSKYKLMYMLWDQV
jgi:hypothetical protein